MRRLAQPLIQYFWGSSVASRCQIADTNLRYIFGVTSKKTEEGAQASTSGKWKISEEDRKGAKSKLYAILKQEKTPLTTAELWERVQGEEELRSKRFMKQMLLHMKKARYIKAKPSGKGSSMGYILPFNLRPPEPGVKFPQD